MATYPTRNTFKIVAATIMIACLFFLSGVNFIIYAKGYTASSLTIGFEDKEIPESPVEEKTTDIKTFSSLQEYLPEQLLHIVCLNNEAIHSIHKAAQLHLVYYEIIAPPPKF